MANSSPTILVKKSDGTFARMSWDEIKKKRGAKAAMAVIAKSETVKQLNPSPVIVQPVITPPVVITTTPVITSSVIIPPIITSPVIPVKTGIQGLTVAVSTTTGSPIKSGMTSGIKSLLDDDALNAPGTSAAIGRDSQVDSVIKKLSFTVPANFFNRLRSAAQLRLKDVRGQKETRATVLRSIKDGGLGLTEAQADELEAVCAAVGNLSARLPTKNRTDLMIEDQILPANIAPHNAFVHAVIPAQDSLGMTMPDRDPDFRRDDKESPFKISPTPAVKTVMKDVVAKTAPVGPVEEIKLFTLTDFRRLSQDPAQAAKRLAQKFLNLKEESVLMFWQAIDAWKLSPLFSDYVSILNAAIFGGKPTATGSGLAISDKEIEALIQMEKSLGI